MSIVNGTRLVRSNLIRPVGLDGEDVARRRGAVDLHVVAARVAVRDIAAVAVVPDERVVARTAVHRVGAAVADDAVVAAAAAEDVVGLAAEDQVGPVGAAQRVHAGAAVDGQQRERADAVVSADRIVAAEPAVRLLRESAPAAADPVREWLLAEAAGNPLALLELPKGLSEAQLEGRAALPEAIPLTARLRS